MKNKRGHTAKKWYPSFRFIYVLFPVTQPFLLDFSQSSDSIRVKNKKNTFKSLSVYLGWPYNIMIPLILYCHGNIIPLPF